MLPRSQHSVAVLSHAHHRGDKRYNTLYRAFCQYLFSKKFRIFSAPPSRFAHGVKAGARESGSFPACGMFRFYSAYGRNRRLRALDYSTLIRASAAVMRFCCRVWRSFTPAMRFCCRVFAFIHACHAVLLPRFAFVHACHAVLLPRLAFVHACHAVLLPRFCVHSRLPCGSVAAFCVRSRLPCGSVAASGVRSRLSCSSMRKKKRLAICSVSVPRGRNRRLQVLMPFEGYRAFFGSLRACAFLYGDSDGVRKGAELRSRRRG